MLPAHHISIRVAFSNNLVPVIFYHQLYFSSLSIIFPIGGLGASGAL